MAQPSTRSSSSLPPRFTAGARWAVAAFVGLAALQFGCSTVHVPKTWRPYVPPDPAAQGQIADATRVAGSDGTCVECHVGCSDPHPRGTVAHCAHCHGGDPTKKDVAGAHPVPLFPKRWPSSANPERPYVLTMKESEAWIQFVNPGDLRVANKTCGPCHQDQTLAVMKSLMTTAQHFWGTVTYANGIVSVKRSILGESYGPDGTPQIVSHVITDANGKRRALDPANPDDKALMQKHSWSAVAVPLPHWEVTQPSNVFRIFEQGSRLGTAALGLNGLASPVPGLPDKNEDPGRPNNKSSDRGLGTLNRVDLPTLNVHKTRLNDPHLSKFGTNDQPGDFRGSGCSACHIIYANDRDPIHSGPYAQFGNLGHGNVGAAVTWMQGSANKAEVADKALEPEQGKPGHPIAHRFTRGMPSSNCMVCHMHQPNSFLNTYYGYQMWSYETDGQHMWPETQKEKTAKERFDILDRNPEGAAQRGKWGDREFLARVAEDINPKAEHTQFADYHGHGWIFRAVFKMDREGHLLDCDDKKIDYDKPGKFAGVIPELGKVPTAQDIMARKCFTPKPGQPVHLKDVHAERGMHCVDCHWAQDMHGDTHLYSEYQASLQIQCQDCHGTATEWATLRYSGPAAKAEDAKDPARKSSLLYLPSTPNNQRRERALTPWGKARIEVSDEGNVYTQRSMLYPDLQWEIPQVKRSVDPTAGPKYNKKAAYAKLVTKADGSCAHTAERMDCAACHTSWMTSCFGCHLPQEANWKTPMHHFEQKELRNWASYNPQVARDDVFMLGISPDVKDNKFAVVRSSSAVMVSSTDSQRAIAYKQQLTVAANGMNGQCFNTHFAHTVRTKETRKCSDCHVGADNDNNAWLAQTYLMGTNYVNFFGMYAYVGADSQGLEAVKITEWEEPQAMIGSNLHRLAYPAEYAAHEKNKRGLTEAHHHSGSVRALEVRGEYLYTASGADGFRVFDIANVANKNFSERIVTAPVSPLGQDTHVKTKFATGIALPTNMSIAMDRPWDPDNREQSYPLRGKDKTQSQYLHESYRYAYVSDRSEGLVLVDINCLTDGNPDNNFTRRALTFNPDGALAGAENVAIAGTTVYVCCDRGLVAIDVDDPLEPKIVATVPLDQPTSVAVQFRYAFVTTKKGLEVVDVTVPAQARLVPGALVELADARDVYVARHYAYVAAGADGVAIVRITRPEAPTLFSKWNADGALVDVNQVKVGMVNDSVYALVADGGSGFHVAQLVTPEDGGRSAYGFSPEPRPKWIAGRKVKGARALAKGLERDRAVDESGNQISVFGRIGGRPFNLAEIRAISLPGGRPVSDEPPANWQPPAAIKK
ncbi:MAG: hypothetical protein WAT39_04170 [Planctomycetota bacterium]